MEDIAGCRAIVKGVAEVKSVYKALKKSTTKNILFRERDYISNPKESGYRGIHLIYKYNGSKDKYRGMAVELQIRSKIQHSWATAVEVVGTFTEQALKASTGDTIWLDFFKYASVEFSKLEGCPIDSRYEGVNTFLEMIELIQKLGLDDRLTAFRGAIRAITRLKGKGAGYFILLLDFERRSTTFTRYGKEQLSEATEFYDEKEKEYENDASKDLVLVSAASVRDLKKAYPNYFSDTDDFRGYLRKVIGANA